MTQGHRQSGQTGQLNVDRCTDTDCSVHGQDVVRIELVPGARNDKHKVVASGFQINWTQRIMLLPSSFVETKEESFILEGSFAIN